jgi:hypothetical protein
MSLLWSDDLESRPDRSLSALGLLLPLLTDDSEDDDDDDDDDDDEIELSTLAESSLREDSPRIGFNWLDFVFLLSVELLELPSSDDLSLMLTT